MAAKKFDSSNTNMKTGKAKAPVKTAAPKPAATAAQKMAAPKPTAKANTPLKTKAMPAKAAKKPAAVAKAASGEAIREAITATKTRERNAGM